MSDTIFALSSGSPPAGIAVVRISGPGADGALQALAGRLPEPRRASLVALRRGGELLDEAIALRFPGPGSATGEDVAELHLHGGRSVVAAVLEVLGGIQGLRAAEPGEFTRRAFLNGRVDLAEAEGLADLLEAETEAQRRAALAMAGGALSREVEALRQSLLGLAAELEAVIDFSDEGEVGEGLPPGWSERLEGLAEKMGEMLRRPPAERLRDGVRVAIAGPPNIGKSTLFNALVGREAAIISPIPGTTRDLVEASVLLGGTAFLFVDTAGLRASDDPIEQIGVERAFGTVAAADLVLWLRDLDERPDPDRTIVVHAKADLGPAHPQADVAVSALTGEGMDALRDLLVARAGCLLPREGELGLNARHRIALGECLERLREARNGDILIAAEALRQARSALDRITGKAGVEDMLDALFGRFCVGK